VLILRICHCSNEKNWQSIKVMGYCIELCLSIFFLLIVHPFLSNKELLINIIAHLSGKIPAVPILILMKIHTIVQKEDYLKRWVWPILPLKKFLHLNTKRLSESDLSNENISMFLYDKLHRILCPILMK